MATYQASENLRLARKISKLVKGGIDPTQEPYVLDDENILSILTLIYEYLVGEQVMFSSVYEGSKAIEDWIKENFPGLAKEETLLACTAIILDALNNIDLSSVAKEDTLTTGINDILEAIHNIEITPISDEHIESLFPEIED